MTNDPISCIAPLFVPANRPDRFPKAAASGADAVIIDLEDAIVPDAKAAARAALSDMPPLAVPFFVRINAVRTTWAMEDIAAVGRLPAAGIILSKTESAADIAAVRRPGLSIIALIESADGIAAARAIAAADGVARLAFGSLDYAADLGCAHTRDAFLAARSELVLASRLAGIAAPLDGVTTRIDDPQAAADDARYAASLGFGGKLCIHPGQIASVLAAFVPTDGEIAWARRIVGASGAGVGLVNGEMIDPPVRLRAERILRRGKT